MYYLKELDGNYETLINMGYATNSYKREVDKHEFCRTS